MARSVRQPSVVGRAGTLCSAVRAIRLLCSVACVMAVGTVVRAIARTVAAEIAELRWRDVEVFVELVAWLGVARCAGGWRSTGWWTMTRRAIGRCRLWWSTATRLSAVGCAAAVVVVCLVAPPLVRRRLAYAPRALWGRRPVTLASRRARLSTVRRVRVVLFLAAMLAFFPFLLLQPVAERATALDAPSLARHPPLTGCGGSCRRGCDHRDECEARPSGPDATASRRADGALLGGARRSTPRGKKSSSQPTRRRPEWRNSRPSQWRVPSFRFRGAFGPPRVCRRPSALPLAPYARPLFVRACAGVYVRACMRKIVCVRVYGCVRMRTASRVRARAHACTCVSALAAQGRGRERAVRERRRRERGAGRLRRGGACASSSGPEAFRTWCACEGVRVIVRGGRREGCKGERVV